MRDKDISTSRKSMEIQIGAADRELFGDGASLQCSADSLFGAALMAELP